MVWGWFAKPRSSTAPPEEAIITSNSTSLQSHLSTSPSDPINPTNAARTQTHTPPSPPSPSLPENVRLRRQLTLLIAGPVFFSASLFVTRRALRRKYLAAVPPLFHSNQHPPAIPPSGALEAFEALNLATLNIASFALTLVGGAMFALDVCNLGELRRRVRGEDGLGGEVMPEKYRELKRLEREAEEEMEEWMVSVLARKEVKERAKQRAEREMSGTL